MAKFLKHLGLSNTKKGPPVPPYPDYVKEQPNEELNGKVNQREDQLDRQLVAESTSRATANGSGSQTSGNDLWIDVNSRKSSRSADRISPSLRGGLSSPTHSSGSGDSRKLSNKRPGPGLSTKEQNPAQPQNQNNVQLQTKGRTNKVGMPLEYSDPIDSVKGQVPEGDEGYSEPYEALKALQKLREEERIGMFGYDEPYDVTKPPEHHPAGPRQGQKSCDTRPRTDYEEPWEFTARKSAALQAHMDALEYGKRLSANISDTWDNGGVSPVSSQKVSSRRDDIRSSDNEIEDDQHKYRQEFGIARAVDMDQEQFMQDSGNYEVPWDLNRKSMELESKFLAASKGINVPAEKLKSDNERYHGTGSRHRSSPPKTSPPPPPTAPSPTSATVDTRPMEEYEDPWDVKAKQIERQVIRAKAAKDRAAIKDREPSIIETVIKQTEMVSMGSPKCSYPVDNGEDSVQVEPENSMSKQAPYPKSMELEDERPQEEYEDPWDTKARARMLSQLMPGGTSVESTPKSSHGTSSNTSQTQSTSQSQQSQSSSDSPAASGGQKKKHKALNLDLGCRSHSAKGERIDPSKPLDQQSWYHGSISRVDAESLLRVHKEGSYLVRNSESTKSDYSLSLKSAKGFMHMKIVVRDDIYILGQFSQPFESIPQMIHHYSVYKLPIKGAEHMSLLHPVTHELL